jgi:hypothetical protein
MQPYLSAYYEATEDVMKESELMKHYYIPEFEATPESVSDIQTDKIGSEKINEG